MIKNYPCSCCTYISTHIRVHIYISILYRCISISDLRIQCFLFSQDAPEAIAYVCVCKFILGIRFLRPRSCMVCRL